MTEQILKKNIQLEDCNSLGKTAEALRTAKNLGYGANLKINQILLLYYLKQSCFKYKAFKVGDEKPYFKNNRGQPCKLDSLQNFKALFL